ncbi:HlyD family secretion protein [Sneathiella sp.]|jgi:multidrug resistance efflux pump|uniref:HlyD family secretion protein n=1 Tax=Sneathiella sp. TaxID=1964365 RepID=UPI0039E72559
MIEIFLCSLLTVLPDYLYRRYVLDMRWGRELTLFSVWYHLRWGITCCVLLALSLITIIFYYHPTTNNVSSFFRTVTIVSETGGRVKEIFVENNQDVKAGDLIFKLDDKIQTANVEIAQRKVSEIDSALIVATSELKAAKSAITQAKSAYEKVLDELRRKEELAKRKNSVVSRSELQSFRYQADIQKAAISVAVANAEAVESKLTSLLPAQRESALSALDKAKEELAKTSIYAGISGRIQQFALKVGEYVNPFFRPAGILVPVVDDVQRFQAGFDQISAQVLTSGMAAEITCFSAPFEIVPMVIVDVQDVIASGQFRPSNELRDIQQTARPGTLTVLMEPIYPEQVKSIPPGSKCIVNAYTNNHQQLEDPETGFMKAIFLHIVDATALVHAAILRIQALLLPVKILVLSGH